MRMTLPTRVVLKRHNVQDLVRQDRGRHLHPQRRIVQQRPGSGAISHRNASGNAAARTKRVPSASQTLPHDRQQQPGRFQRLRVQLIGEDEQRQRRDQQGERRPARALSARPAARRAGARASGPQWAGPAARARSRTPAWCIRNTRTAGPARPESPSRTAASANGRIVGQSSRFADRECLSLRRILVVGRATAII